MRIQKQAKSISTNCHLEIDLCYKVHIGGMAEASGAAFGAAIGVAIAMAVVMFALRGRGHPEEPE